MAANVLEITKAEATGPDSCWASAIRSTERARHSPWMHGNNGENPRGGMGIDCSC